MSHTVAPTLLFAALALPAAASAAPPEAPASRAVDARVDTKQVQRGRYLVKITGCNDCHTAGYAEAGGKVPEPEWLKGDSLGWRGPWGTTYPVNLRLYMSGMTEAQWVRRAKTLETRPPMPWFALHDMSQQDLKAIYQYVKYLGPAGEPAPAFVAPGTEPRTAYIQFPQSPK